MKIEGIFIVCDICENFLKTKANSRNIRRQRRISILLLWGWKPKEELYLCLILIFPKEGSISEERKLN